MTMSIGLARIINDPDATVLTRKALGALSNPVLVVTDKGLTIDNDGLLALRLKSGGGLTEDADGLSATASSACFTETVCIQTSDEAPQLRLENTHVSTPPETHYATVLMSGIGAHLIIDTTGDGSYSSGGGFIVNTPINAGFQLNSGPTIKKFFSIFSVTKSFLLDGTSQFFNISYLGITPQDAVFISPVTYPGPGVTSWSARCETDIVQLRVTTANTGGSSIAVQWQATGMHFV